MFRFRSANPGSWRGPRSAVAAHRGALLVLLLSGMLSSLRAATWREFQSAHFDLYTDATPERAEEFLGSIEEFRAAIARRLRLRVADEYRVRVIMFTIADDFALFVPKVYAPVNVRGMALSGTIDPLFFGRLPYLKTEPERERRVFFHEFTHVLYSDAYAAPPLWFSEGIAELFSTFRVKGDHCTFGAVVPEHLVYLRYHPRLPLPRLFAMAAESPEFVDASSSGVFYPEAWAFLHFCTYGSEPPLTSELMRLVNRQRAGEAPTERLMESAFGMPAAELERRFDTYLKTDAYREGVMPFAVDRRTRFAQRELGDGERQAMLGALAIRTHEPKDAVEQLRALIAKWPASFAPHVELAILALRGGDRALAAVELCRASELQPGNARFAAAAARTVLENAATTAGPRGLLSSPDVEALRRIAARARETWPDSEWTLGLLAETEARAPAMDDAALRRLDAAHARNALGSSALLALARIRHRQQHESEALQLLDQVLENGDVGASVRQEAQELRAEMAKAAVSSPPAVP